MTGGDTICKHPLKGFPIGKTAAGKIDYKVTSYSADHIEKYIDGKFYVANSEERSPYATKVISEFIQIPCGQCIECRMQYSREWANRCMLELQYHDSAYFVTLTYNDENVPKRDYIDTGTGEKLKSLSLYKRDLQLFFKRLRKRYPNDKIRYFCAGEYGSETFRPHYHCIIYGLHLDDLVFYKNNFQGDSYFISSRLTDVWGNGHVVVSNVTWETAAYTARYIMKKHKGSEAIFYDMHNIEPEFTVMSTKPGIARQYYDEHPDLYKYDFIHLPNGERPLKFKPPRYYDKLYDVEHHEEMQEIKQIRLEMAEHAAQIKLSKTSKSYLEMLADEELNLILRTSALVRDKI